MHIAFFGSSLVSAYWNGAATYYRGIIRALAALGYRITFFEPDAFERQKHRDMADPDWAQVVVYPATEGGLYRALEQARSADIVIKASGVGIFDALLEDEVLTLQRAGTPSSTGMWTPRPPSTEWPSIRPIRSSAISRVMISS